MSLPRNDAGHKNGRPLEYAPRVSRKMECFHDLGPMHKPSAGRDYWFQVCQLCGEIVWL